MLRASIVLTLIYTASHQVSAKNSSEEVCFHPLGCFSTLPPWAGPNRPIPRPVDPKIYDANLVFYARESDPKGIRVSLYPTIGKTPTRFKANRQLTVLILPGVGAARIADDTWPVRLKDAILKHRDANVFIANNTGGFRTIDKFFAAANAPVVARHYSRFIHKLKKEEYLPTAKLWAIGFGLGAHIAGYVGKETRLNRITALDPAQELFEGTNTQIRLCKSDAENVDVIHTDSRPLVPDAGIGYMNNIGHWDFYLNGAHQQPGCKFPRPLDLVGYSTIVDNVKIPTHLIAESILCAHKLAHRIFIESLDNSSCTMWGHPGTYENFLLALANAGTDGSLDEYTAFNDKCDMKRCAPIGFDTPYAQKQGVFIVNTYGSPPYCMGDNVRQEIQQRHTKKFLKSVSRKMVKKLFKGL